MARLPANQLQRLGHDDDVRVVPHIAGCRAQVNDPLCLGALLAVGVDVGHDVVAHQLLPLLRHIVVDVVRVAFQLLDLLIGDGKSQLLLRLRQSDPQAPPCAELHIR